MKTKEQNRRLNDAAPEEWSRASRKAQETEKQKERREQPPTYWHDPSPHSIREPTQALQDFSSKATQTQVGGCHYSGMVIQPIEFALANNLGPCEAAVLKYICRHERKGGVEDINKAIHYLNLLKENMYV